MPGGGVSALRCGLRAVVRPPAAWLRVGCDVAVTPVTPRGEVGVGAASSCCRRCTLAALRQAEGVGEASGGRWGMAWEPPGAWGSTCGTLIPAGLLLWLSARLLGEGCWVYEREDSCVWRVGSGGASKSSLTSSSARNAGPEWEAAGGVGGKAKELRGCWDGWNTPAGGGVHTQLPCVCVCVP